MVKKFAVVVGFAVSMLLCGVAMANGPVAEGDARVNEEVLVDLNNLNAQTSQNTEDIAALKARPVAREVFVSPSPYYVGVIGGMTFGGDSEVGVNKSEVNFDEGYYAGVNAGRVFNNFRVEAELAHQQVDNDVISWTGDTKLDTLMANLYYSFGVMENVSIYTMGGAGAGQLDVSDEGTDGSNTVFVSNVGAGVTYAINDHVAADVGYKYMMMGNTVINDEDISYNTSIVTAGMRYMF